MGLHGCHHEGCPASCASCSWASMIMSCCIACWAICVIYCTPIRVGVGVRVRARVRVRVRTIFERRSGDRTWGDGVCDFFRGMIRIEIKVRGMVRVRVRRILFFLPVRVRVLSVHETCGLGLGLAPCIQPLTAPN